MPTLYHEYNRREQFLAPQFNRSRHRYRGPRESFKINLEIDQFAFSVHRLYESYEDFREEFIMKASLLLSGGESGFNDEDDQSVLLPGYEELVARLQRLQSRARALEA